MGTVLQQGDGSSEGGRFFGRGKGNRHGVRLYRMRTVLRKEELYKINNQVIKFSGRGTVLRKEGRFSGRRTVLRKGELFS